MLDGFKRKDIQTSGARIVTVTGGSGPPLLMMHGNPFNHLSWLKVAPTLAREFTVVLTDLRGYGDSEKPPGGADHSGYSFRAMAQDQVEVMAALGFDSYFAAGHDRGARVLHRMCLDHPAKVKRAALLDIVPQYHVYNHINKQWATFSWHWFFNIQPEPLPEKMMGFDPDWFIEKKLAKTAQGLSFFDPGSARRIQALLPQSGDHPRHLRGLSRRRRHRSRARRQGLQGRPQDRMPGAAAVGRDRRCRPQSQSGPGRDLEGLCLQYRRRQDGAERPLSHGRGAQGDDRSVARVFCRQVSRRPACTRVHERSALRLNLTGGSGASEQCSYNASNSNDDSAVEFVGTVDKPVAIQLADIGAIIDATHDVESGSSAA